MCWFVELEQCSSSFCTSCFAIYLLLKFLSRKELFLCKYSKLCKFLLLFWLQNPFLLLNNYKHIFRGKLRLTRLWLSKKTLWSIPWKVPFQVQGNWLFDTNLSRNLAYIQPLESHDFRFGCFVNSIFREFNFKMSCNMTAVTVFSTVDLQTVNFEMAETKCILLITLRAS